MNMIRSVRAGAPLVLLATMLAGCASLTQAVKNQTCALDLARPFDVVEVDPARHEVRLFWKDAGGDPYLTLDRVRAAVEAAGDSLVAATNAGIYEPGFTPTGLFIEDGERLHPLNLDDGAGNFFLKPNGVFFLTADGARIVESAAFDNVPDPVRFATQSGPLLLRGGQVHPAFTPGSENCRLRSGVGVGEGGRVYLAISNGAVSFYDFATFFRDALGVRDALYLDGGISELYAPALGRTDAGRQRYAGILAVVVKRAPSPDSE